MAERGRPRKYPVGEGPTASARYKDYYERKKSEGKCVQCGKSDTYGGYLRCEDCLNKGQDAKRARYKPKPRVKIVKGLILIKEKKKLRWGQRYQRLKSSGLCVRCMKPSDLGMAYCSDCRPIMVASNKVSKQKIKDRGLCIRCRKNQTGDGFAWCEPCRGERKQKIAK